MSDKLREEIERILPSAAGARSVPFDVHEMCCSACAEKDLLLQRCLSAMKWIPVSEQIPEPGKKVLLRYHNSYGKQRTVCGMHLPRYFMESHDDEGDADLVSEYCEEKDTFYYVEGWWEIIENWGEYSFILISEEVIEEWKPID